jgi:hypothetical protein
MEPVPAAVPEVFCFYDTRTGHDVVAWRLLCRPARKRPTRH